MDCSFLLNCARFFEKLMEKRRTSYLEILHFVWLQNWVYEFNYSWTFWLCSVLFCMKSSFEPKEFLNFFRPEPLKCWKEQKGAKWSADMARKIFESLTISWKMWEIKLWSSLCWIGPEKCCCLKVYCICFEFLTHLTSHRSSFCLISSNLHRECFFRRREATFASRSDQEIN